MDFNEVVEKALLTWYPKDHELHLDPHHPLGKLLGEWGELLDDYMKSLYKPGYVFEPEDELGDIWYYMRILCYQRCHTPEKMIDSLKPETDCLIVKTINILSTAFLNVGNGYGYNVAMLDYAYTVLVEITRRYNLTLDDLTCSNWEKLKPGSERGDEWMKARVETDYVREKIGLK